MGRQRKIASGVGERLFSVLNTGNNIDLFAKELNTPMSTINNYLRGDREPSYNFLLRLKQKTDVDLNWLISGVENTSKPSFLSDTTLSIPQYEVSQADGKIGIKRVADASKHIHINRNWLSQPFNEDSCLGVMTADGDSMHPTFQSGDLLIADFNITDNKLVSGGIYVADFQGNFFIRRLQRMGDGSIEIIADNTRYKSERISVSDADTGLNLHGEVIWIGSQLRNLR